MWAYNLLANKIARSKCIFVENNKIEIFFLTIYSLESKSEGIVRK